MIFPRVGLQMANTNLHPHHLSIRNDSFYPNKKCTLRNNRGCIVSKLESLAILVEQNRYPPFKARTYGLFWHFRGKKFKVKTMDAFLKFSKKKGFEPSQRKNLENFKADLRRIILNLPMK